ncbi:RAB6-interacting golgin-like [Limulus polyphemus]|uniref:RAB6-interacting golgin n=1 Tax=Limulus polyphemus TaxID=6850 RepID=A0ABM1B0T4_LIMPO|nr:RAB6-interacting golgin-like [Limulus polyphemus]
MMEWSGFTEEELERIRGGSGKDTSKTILTIQNQSPSISNERGKPVKNLAAKRAVRAKRSIISTASSESSGISPEQRLSKPVATKNNKQAQKDIQGKATLVSRSESLDKNKKESSNQEISVESCSGSKSSNLSEREQGKGKKEPSMQIDFERKHDSKHEKEALEKFQQRQKHMEEENAKRKQLLARAIADRKKRTQAEAKKLSNIQEELSHLDSVLSVDVSVLRDQIETASIEFYEAQKRYDKAEKEFVEAKLDLFKKMEQKEELTERLCTIIEQNEARKARKLYELMKQLEMESMIEECEVIGIENILPLLCSLNDATYSYCTTIKPPVSVSSACKPCLSQVKKELHNSISKEETIQDKPQTSCKTNNIVTTPPVPTEPSGVVISNQDSSVSCNTINNSSRDDPDNGDVKNGELQGMFPYKRSEIGEVESTPVPSVTELHTPLEATQVSSVVEVVDNENTSVSCTGKTCAHENRVSSSENHEKQKCNDEVTRVSSCITDTLVTSPREDGNPKNPVVCSDVKNNELVEE